MTTVLMGFSSLAHLSGHRSVSDVIIQTMCIPFPWAVSYFPHFIDVDDPIISFFGVFYFAKRAVRFGFTGAAELINNSKLQYIFILGLVILFIAIYMTGAMRFKRALFAN